MNKNYDVIAFVLKLLYFTKARVANYTDIIQILTIFIKTIFKDSKKVKIKILKVKMLKVKKLKCKLYLY